MVANGKVKSDDVRFYLGYSGWGVGQLLNELKENSWIIAKANYRHIFQSDNKNLWRSILKEMGGVYSTMAGYPENPILN
jgi:putative transcriptional regulator